MLGGAKMKSRKVAFEEDRREGISLLGLIGGWYAVQFLLILASLFRLLSMIERESERCKLCWFLFCSGFLCSLCVIRVKPASEPHFFCGGVSSACVPLSGGCSSW